MAHDVVLEAPRRRSGLTLAWRRRVVVLIALLGCLGIYALARTVAATPYVDVVWRSEGRDVIELVSSPVPALRVLSGARLTRIGSADGRTIAADDGVLLRSPRWIVSDAQRQALPQAQLALASMLQGGNVQLHFENSAAQQVPAASRGLGGLGVPFWLLCAIALSLVLLAASVLLAHPSARNLPYAVIAGCQACNLLVIGVEALPGLGQPQWTARHSLELRTAFDLFSAAAMVHLSTLQPLRLPYAGAIAAAAWLASAVLWAGGAVWQWPLAWWWTQLGMLGCGLLTIALMLWSYRIEPNPFAVLMRHLATAATVTLLLLCLAVAASSGQQDVSLSDTLPIIVVWYLFLAAVILVLPIFSRSRPLLRELCMLAGTSTIATSLDLAFVALFSLGPFTALSLSVFAALAVYVGTRRWLFQQISDQHLPGAERMFERLYRVVRELEANPRSGEQLLTRLLRELFEPLEVRSIERRFARSRVLGNGSALLVPVPAIDAGQQQPAADASIVLRFADRGRRMFTRDDARLGDSVVEQLRRAVAYDKAVERGRSEERTRIAQDLHDDIGARLLTLMYRSETPEMEDYIRNTLKDLKTLTRGLAAAEHRLSDASAEWKADIAQRLGAAQIELHWSFGWDRDAVLGVVQWSALTRVLRELVSNTIQHSCATRVELAALLQQGGLDITLADDGIGRNPQAWSHGLGLGGVRKRVRLLGGEVQWRENGRSGIVCTIRIPDIERPAGTA